MGYLFSRIVAIIVFLLLWAAGASAQVTANACANELLPVANPPTHGNAPNFVVKGRCYVLPNKNYFYGKINIVENGELIFDEAAHGGSTPASDAHTNLWASSIIIENKGVLKAAHSCGGSPLKCTGRFGESGSDLTIHIYGKDQAVWNGFSSFTAQNQGATCSDATCGVPSATWTGLHYEPLYGDARCTDGSIWSSSRGCGITQARVGYFGDKVLAVSYGGTLDLQGYKAASDIDETQTGQQANSGLSWMRLADSAVGQNENGDANHPGSLEPGGKRLFLERAPNSSGPKPKWAIGDEIVVTTTDYLPGHSEKLTITQVNGAQVDFAEPIKWSHNSRRYGGPKEDATKQWTTRLPDRLKATDDKGTLSPTGGGIDPNLVSSGAETRAAVALLNRSIRIVSAGDNEGAPFPTEYEADNKTVKPCTIDASGVRRGVSCYHYGAHMMVRQGFAAVHISGVEFKQMGQGGRMGHYPVHFHMVGNAPDGTYVKDSSINESMTRFITLHASQNVTLARNVGYLSIGHGYYLEDASEAYNRLYSNIGIFARAAVDNVQNTRKVPGILAYQEASCDPACADFPYRSDVVHPTVFWITNGWNDFVGNMAAGAGACGSSYWLVPAFIKDMPPPAEAVGGYESVQRDRAHTGMAPLKSFSMNYATSTMHSFQTTTDAPACTDFGFYAARGGVNPPATIVRAVKGFAKTPNSAPMENDTYYPHVLGPLNPTSCPAGKCRSVSACVNVGAPATPLAGTENCTANIIDHFTTAYHWAGGNVSAIWLRYKWFLVDNSVLSDVQQGGITFITGGDFTHASIPIGYWGLARNSIFIGNTRDNAKYPYSSNKGPYPSADFTCDRKGNDGLPSYCLNANAGISMQFGGWFTNQRLANIYDGPSYQDSVAYLDVKAADCPVSAADATSFNANCLYGNRASYLALRKKPGVVTREQCYVPNAAIAWKHPNGFYYAPAFHVKNVHFDKVDIRHFVINPLFAPLGKYKQSGGAWVPDPTFKPEWDFGQGGTYLSNKDAFDREYCTGDRASFNADWSAIDRQTELNDDDGSLTGLSNDTTASDPRLKQTISVNQDQFFGAPVDTPECSSAQEPFDSSKGNTNPAQACGPIDSSKPAPTARTSPYDYVSTVLWHTSDPRAENQNNPPWSRNCAQGYCYGVPLYRQYLTQDEMKRWTDGGCDAKTKQARSSGGADPMECRWPFIRMSGMSIGARQTMTINNGRYYIETTKSEGTQRSESYYVNGNRSYNEFQNSQKYYMFFVYAKETTTQTYDIYVGKNFKYDPEHPEASDLKLARIGLETLEFGQHTKEENLPQNGAAKSWVEYVNMNSSTGILTVRVNFKAENITKDGKKIPLNPASPDSTFNCKPSAFCVREGGVCGANRNNPVYANANPALAKEIDYVCKTWAVKDLDCPEGGCLGLTFVLPVDFAADDKYRRPLPELYPSNGGDAANPQGQPTWATNFKQTSIPPDNATGGQCYYPKVPPCAAP